VSVLDLLPGKTMTLAMTPI